MLDRRGPGGIRASSPIWLASFRINGARLPTIAPAACSSPGDLPISTAPRAGRA